MTIQVRAADGTIQSFPDGTSPAAVKTAMLAYDNKDSWGGLAGKVAGAVRQKAQAAMGPKSIASTPDRSGSVNNIGAQVADGLGKLWSSPNTALGLMAAGGAYAAGKLAGTDPKFTIGDNAIQLQNSPFGDRALALGNVQIYPDEYGPDYLIPHSYTGVPVRAGDHEAGHAMQGQILGPLFIPAEILGATLMGKRNPIEVGADKFATGRSKTGF